MIEIKFPGLLEWSDSGLCVSGKGPNRDVELKTCDPEDESQMVEVGVDTAGGDIAPLSEPQWRERMAGRRTKELGEALAEVGKVLEEIRELNTSGELRRERGSRRAAVFYLDRDPASLAQLRWWLYAWHQAGLDTAAQALDLVVFTHPLAVDQLPEECGLVTENFDPGAETLQGPGLCVYKELLPLSERNPKYDHYLNSQECMFNADTSGFLLRYKLLMRADLDTFPTPALVDFWPWDIICDTHAVTNHYLHSIEDAIVDTAAAAGTNIMWEC